MVESQYVNKDILFGFLFVSETFLEKGFEPLNRSFALA